jgi:hypothetical protein
MLRLSEIASKFSFILLAMIAIPSVTEMETIISIWLKDVPEYTVMFSQYVLITALIDQLTIGLIYANHAIGNIRSYSIIINTIKILTLPAAYICLMIGLSPVSVMICMLFFEFICCISRLFFLRKTGGLIIREFILKVFAPEFIPVICAVVICCISHCYFPQYLWWLSFFLSMSVLSIITYWIGLCPDEKQIIDEILVKFLNTIQNRRS